MTHLVDGPWGLHILRMVEGGKYHVLASKYQSKDLETVRKYTFDFAEEVLGLQPSNDVISSKNRPENVIRQ